MWIGKRRLAFRHDQGREGWGPLRENVAPSESFGHSAVTVERLGFESIRSSIRRCGLSGDAVYRETRPSVCDILEPEPEPHSIFRPTSHHMPCPTGAIRRLAVPPCPYGVGLKARGAWWLASLTRSAPPPPRLRRTVPSPR